MRLEGGKAVRGAGWPGGEGVDAVESMIAAGAAPREVLNGEGACWATVVAAAGASAGPVPHSEGTAKTGAKAVSAAGKNLHGSDGDRRWRRQLLHKRRIPHKEQEVVNPYT